MALKRKITKAELDALPTPIAAEYRADGDDFVLQAEGFDDPVELKRAKEHEVTARKAAETEVTRLKTQLATIQQTDALRTGDVAALEASWKEKLAIQKADSKVALDQKDRFIQSTLVDSVATSIAAELSGDNAALLLPHITPRLVADLSGERPLTRIVDKDGKPSALSVDDLKKELSGNKLFAPIIIASKASGGGAAGKSGNGGAGTGQKKFNELNDQERTDWFKRDPDSFQQASAVATAAATEARRAF